jgi:hypothetical protein
MSHNFTTEIGRMRTEEAIARADRYRLARQAQRAKSQGHKRLSWSRTFVYRRVIAAVGLSALMLFGLVAVAQARPAGVGPSGEVSDITATKNHPQVKGENPGQPVRSEHAYKGENPGQPVRSEHAYIAGDPNAVALRLRAEYYRQRYSDVATFSGDAVAQLRALNEPSVGTIDAVAQLRALNEPSVGTTDAVALRLRAEYYRQRYSDVATFSGNAVADLRALNEPSVGTTTAAIADLRSLNEPSVGTSTDTIAQLRALNEPSVGTSTDTVAQLRALNEPSVGTIDTVALRLRAEYYRQLSGNVASFSNDAVADLRALNEPSAGTITDAVAQLRALNGSSAGSATQPVAQLRAMNEPFSTTNVPGAEASVEPEEDFPLLQSLAVIAGVLVLGSAALMVVVRNQQSPKTV